MTLATDAGNLFDSLPDDIDEELHLTAGCHLTIPAHTKHKVTWTTPDTETLWLAVHYK